MDTGFVCANALDTKISRKRAEETELVRKAGIIGVLEEFKALYRGLSRSRRRFTDENRRQLQKRRGKLKGGTIDG